MSSVLVALPVTKHLPGKHDQKTHGKGGSSQQGLPNGGDVESLFPPELRGLAQAYLDAPQSDQITYWNQELLPPEERSSAPSIREYKPNAQEQAALDAFQTAAEGLAAKGDTSDWEPWQVAYTQVTTLQSVKMARVALQKIDPAQVETALAQIERVRADGTVCVAMDLGSFYRMVGESGTIDVKNQFETGRSNGVFDPRRRMMAESITTGTAMTAGAGQRPVYGFLSMRGDGAETGVGQYGDVRLVLKDSVKERAGMVVGDTLANSLPSNTKIAVPLTGKVSRERLLLSAGGGQTADVRNLKPESVDAISGLHYFETQIFGGVKASDIESVTIVALRRESTIMDYNSKRDIADALRAAGVKVEFTGELVAPEVFAPIITPTIPVSKHLPGKHDQKTHAHGGAAADLDPHLTDVMSRAADLQREGRGEGVPDELTPEQYEAAEIGEWVEHTYSRHQELLDALTPEQSDFTVEWVADFDAVTRLQNASQRIVEGDTANLNPYEESRARAGLKMVAHSSPTTEPLYRGLSLTPEDAAAMQPGGELKIPLSSFATGRSTAMEYAYQRGDGREQSVVFELEAGARAIPMVAFEPGIQGRAAAMPGEHVTSGVFEITGVRRQAESGSFSGVGRLSPEVTVVSIRQKSVFDGEEVMKAEFFNLPVTKHLPGKHDQKDHAGKGKGSGAFAEWGDRAAEIEAAGSRGATLGDLRDAAEAYDHDKLFVLVRSIYEMEYPVDGSGTISTRVTAAQSKGDKVVVEGDVWGTLADGTVRNIGDFTRTISVSDMPEVKNDGLVLRTAWQGRGFAGAFNRNAENWYISQGIQSVRVEAGMDVGGYAWARQGFGWAWHQPVPQITLFRLKDVAAVSELPSGLRDQIHSIQKRSSLPKDHPDFPTPLEIANLGKIPQLSQSVGQYVLMGTHWYGVKWLTPDGKQPVAKSVLVAVPVTKHLPGKHNQKDHAGKGKGADASAGSVMGLTYEQSEALDKKPYSGYSLQRNAEDGDPISVMMLEHARASLTPEERIRFDERKNAEGIKKPYIEDAERLKQTVATVLSRRMSKDLTDAEWADALEEMRDQGVMSDDDDVLLDILRRNPVTIRTDIGLERPVVQVQMDRHGLGLDRGLETFWSENNTSMFHPAASPDSQEAREAAKAAIAARLVRQWASTSNDNAPLSLAIQSVAARTFGKGHETPWHNPHPVTVDKASKLADPNSASGKLLSSFLTQQYASTQEMFARAGVSEIELYRGFAADTRGEVFRQIRPGLPASVSVMGRPISSWSSSIHTAREFGRPGGEFTVRQIVFKTKVPVSDILSCPASGNGCLSEGEFTVLQRGASPFRAVGFRAVGAEKIRDFELKMLTETAVV